MDNGAESYRRFLTGDGDALAGLIRDYKDGLILFLNRYVNDLYAAEELTEDVFFRLAVKKPRFRESASFKTWLYAVGRNEALSYLRKRARLSDTPAEARGDLADEAAELERAYLREERRIAVHRALARLRPDYAAGLYLRYFEDMTPEQAAKVLKKTKRQFANLSYQAKLALKRELEKEGISDEGL